MGRWTRRLAIKMSFLFGGFVVVLILLFYVSTKNQQEESLEEKFGLMLEHTVATAALQIDGDDHLKIRTRADVATPEFQRIKAILRRVQDANELTEEGIYTGYLVDGTLVAAVMLQDVAYTGDRNVVVPENRATVDEVMRSGKAGHTRLYMDEHGEWVSAYAPIRDRAGRIVALLEADYRLSTLEEELRKEHRTLALACSMAALIAIGIAILFGRRLEHDLQRIRQGAHHIEHENYGHRIVVRSKDELGLVASQFNRMAEVLSERFHMLKFLPRHTLDAIQRRAKEGRGTETERMEASIFFSDIRGYTPMSEGLSAEKIVQMLNTYLRRQAEIIEEQGGTVDKFIGDAVLAVFAGAGHEARAVEAALQIQDAIDDMNARKAFEREVHVGIGVASGGLVLGEVGSEGRRERTLIGSTVNLASRLCSRAGAGEVVIADPTLQKLGGLVPVSHSDAVELKGFTGAQWTHTVRVATGKGA